MDIEIYGYIVRKLGVVFYNSGIFYFFPVISTMAACLSFFTHAGYSQLSFHLVFLNVHCSAVMLFGPK